MAKVIHAKFASTCKVCKQKYATGTAITMHPEKGWGHVECPAPVAEVVSEPVTDHEIDCAVFDGKNCNCKEVASEPEDVLSHVNDSDNLLDQINQIKQQIQEKKHEKELVEVALPGFDAAISSCNEAERELYEEYVKASQKIREERLKTEKEKAETNKALSGIEDQLSKLEKDLAQANSAIAAQAELDAIKKELEKYFADTTWGQCAYDYQIEDIVYTLRRFKDGERVIMNANKMGAGKMLETQASVDILRDQFQQQEGRIPRILWVTSKSLRMETQKQFQKWCDNIQAVVLTGKDRDMRNMFVDLAIQGNYPLICNYDALGSTPQILNYDWDIVVVDEVSAIKNHENTQRFLNLRKIVLKDNWKWEEDPHKVRFMITMTGTPVENKAEDMWAHLHLANPKRFPTIGRFISEFTWSEEKYNEKKMKWETVKNADIDRILKAMVGRVIRQDPKRIDAGRPDKIVYQEFVEHTEAQQEIITKIGQGILAKLEDAAGEGKEFSISAFIAELMYLRQANVYPGGIKVKMDDGTTFTSKTQESGKIDRTLEIIEELDGEGENVVVWSTFKSPLYRIEELCKERGISVAVITGDTKEAERDAIKSLFDEGEIRVLATVLSASGGEVKGANFNKSTDKKGGASKAIFLDLWYNPAINEQAEDRIWRQNNTEPAEIYQILVDESVDEFILGIIQEKENLRHGLIERDELRPAAEWISMIKGIL